MIKRLRENYNYKLIIGFIIGFLLSGIGVYATTVLSSREVSYDNSKSGGSSTNVQGAIEELYKKVDTCDGTQSNTNALFAYTYNQTTGASNYCVTGEESTCQKTDCYTSSSKTCPSGTIIDYKVNSENTIRFHVMYDEGKKITMQSQKNIVNNISWYSSDDNTKGPLTVLEALENATANWSNVNNQTYTMGTTVFQSNQWTGCDSDSSCTMNTYTLASRTAKARMITVQEASKSGCTTTAQSCPKWMQNYLWKATDFGASVSDNTTDSGSGRYGYWAMNAYTGKTTDAWHIARQGRFFYGIPTTYAGIGARAVIIINK